jgi:hypothetical protein
MGVGGLGRSQGQGNRNRKSDNTCVLEIILFWNEIDQKGKHSRMAIIIDKY